MARRSRAPASDRRTPALFHKLNKIVGQVSAGPSPEEVHQLRTTIRRFETLVAAAGKKRGSAKLLKPLARLRRRAGKVRDLDVQLAALREIRLETAGADKARVMRSLQKLHKKREKKLITAAKSELADGLSTRLEDARRNLRRQPETTARKDYTSAALDKFAKLARSSPPLNEDTLHSFRMACKRVRYLAEMSGENASAEQIVSQLKRIQDAIGEWHDLVSLVETAEGVISIPHSPLLTILRTRARSEFIQALRITAEAKTALLRMRGATYPIKGPESAPQRKVVQLSHGAFAVAS